MNKAIEEFFKKYNFKEQLTTFFSLLKKLIEQLGIDADDPRLVINIRNDSKNRISVSINGRLVMMLKSDSTGNQMGFMTYINDRVFLKEHYPQLVTEYHVFDPFKNLENAEIVVLPAELSQDALQTVFETSLKCIKDYLPTASRSQYRVHHMAEMFEMAIDPQRLQDELAQLNLPPLKLLQLGEIMVKIRNLLTPQAHPLLQHTWSSSEKAQFRQISPFPEGNPMNKIQMHYEVRLLGNDIVVEFHHEGKPEEKRQFGAILSNPVFNAFKKAPWFTLGYPENKRIFVNTYPLSSTSDLDDIAQRLRSDLTALYSALNPFLKEITTTLSETQTTTPRNNMKMPLNTILYGPPGTGKTYHTINKAISIIDPDFDLNQSRVILTKRFTELVNSGQIVFTTFHQSMSYEDFVEGIKPLEPKEEGQHISYKIVDGIFKRAAATAAFYCYQKYILSKSKPSSYTFDELYDSFIEYIEEQMEAGKHPVFKSLTGREVEVKKVNSNNSIIARAKNSIAKRSAPLTKENIQKLYDRFKTIDEIRDLKQVEETVQVTPRTTEFYAVFGGLKDYEKQFTPDIQWIGGNQVTDSIEEEEILVKFNAGVYNEAIKSYGKEAEKAVLIIDEINRGNVSQVFGELITLIEDDKRMGNKEALEVTLPYSKSKFGVPQNLHIIGTMNTADRSIEALDSALRRRFSFVEMPPDYNIEALEKSYFDIHLRDLLRTLNARIEKLLNRDYCIGHSYFLNINSSSDLRRAFFDKIIPLLQEYFYGDYGKMGLVLGSGFVVVVDSSDIQFAKFEYENSSDYNEKKMYDIKHFDQINWETEFGTALRKLMEIEK